MFLVHIRCPNTKAGMSSILWVQAIGGWNLCTPHPIGKDTCNTIICTLSGQLVSTTPTSCFGVNDGLVEVQAISGTAPYFYVLDSFFNKISSNLQFFIIQQIELKKANTVDISFQWTTLGQAPKYHKKAN